MDVFHFFYLIVGLENLKISKHLKGYFLGYFLSVPWFLVTLTTLHYISKLISNENQTTPNKREKRGSLSHGSNNSVSGYFSNRMKRITSSNEIESNLNEKGMNKVINIIISNLISKLDFDFINESMDEFKPNFLEKIELRSIISKNDFKINNIECIYNSEKNTIIEFDFEFKGNGNDELNLEYMIRPRVLPLDLKCIINEIKFYSKIEIEIIYFGGHSGGHSIGGGHSGLIDEIKFCFKQQPEFNYSIQMFESLDIFNSMPSLNLTLKKYINDFLKIIVFPNKLSLMKITKLKEIPNNIFDNSIIGDDVLFELEDEIKNSILNVNELLQKKLNGKNKEIVKKEIFLSVLNFLKFGTKNDKIPFSMFETVQKSFQILNNLIFEDEKKIDENLLNLLLKEENINFISHVVHNCAYADELIRSIFKIKNEKIQKKVNEILNQFELQDLFLLVLNRNNHLNYQ
eukprot:gene5425-9238_t